MSKLNPTQRIERALFLELRKSLYQDRDIYIDIIKDELKRTPREPQAFPGCKIDLSKFKKELLQLESVILQLHATHLGFRFPHRKFHDFNRTFLFATPEGSFYSSSCRSTFEVVTVPEWRPRRFLKYQHTVTYR